ncbi:hypothetical protein F5Y18DRAFT_329607 [Xylariaceae sp. FL1019]|nr:hypothetical protein F5Y18DRAFT_329607 [Xylariaceae sp. FL1019]
MLPSVTFAQASLATAIGVGAIGVWIGSSPPRATPDLHKMPTTGDTIRRLVVAQEKYMFHALHHVSLVLTYPNIPASLLRHGGENGLDARYLTWSKTTAIPLAAMICVGGPLRLLSYAGLGKNFTFGLSEPDRLNTEGLYKYLQHPSYTGIAFLMTGMYGLWGRVDGVLSCIIPPSWYPTLLCLGTNRWSLHGRGILLRNLDQSKTGGTNATRQIRV